MKFIVILSVGLCASLWLVAGFAQARMAATIAQESAAKNAGTRSAPQMEKLIQALAGEWSTEETYGPSDRVPKGGTGHSRDSYRVGPARSSLIEEYHSERAAGKSWGIGIIWWDAEARGFHFVWCDSYALDRDVMKVRCLLGPR